MKPPNADSFYNEACYYALQGNVEQAIENLQGHGITNIVQEPRC